MTWQFVTDIHWPEPPLREVREVVEFSKRRRRPRFYADENFPRTAENLLKESKLSVLTAREAGTLQHSDESHIALARRERRILLTQDRDFLNERKFPLIACPTIVVLHFATGSRSDIVAAFQCLNYILLCPQFYDKWSKFDATPSGWTEWIRFQDGTTSRDRFRFLEGRLQIWTP